MRTPTRSTPHLLAALLTACAVATACGGHDASPQAAPTAQTGSTTIPTDARAAITDEPASTVPPEQVTTADYKVLAAGLYKERAAIDTQMTTLANESASASTRVEQINDQLLPALEHLLGEAEDIQPEDPTAANLHQHLLTSLQTTIAAYQDLATGLSDNDPAALARGRSELTNETQDLAIWVHGVPTL
jgi:hypothetical protein